MRTVVEQRIVDVVALATAAPVMVPAARVRLKAMTARTSHAAFAVKFPEGRCATVEPLRSELTCSMIACRRWTWSAVIVSRSVVVKKAWNRCVSKRVGWARSFFFSSGIRRTTRRPTMWSFFALEVNAVKGTSATSALEIQVLVLSSKIASV